MQFIDAAAIDATLSFPVLVDAIEAAHRRPKIEAQDVLMGPKETGYFVRSAHDHGRYMASKLVTTFPANPGRSTLPSVQAICVLFDGTDGRPLAVMDGAALTHWKTAADSALGVRLLAPATAETLLVVGAGHISKWLARAHRSVRPSLRDVMIWNRDPARAEGVAAILREEGIAARTVLDLAGAVRTADIISTCTGSLEPLVSGRDLKPGVHLDLVGSHRIDMREVDDEAVRRSRVYVDLRASGHDVGELQIPIARGVLREADIRGDLYDLVGGTIEGRSSASDITFFKNAGGGHLDLMTAECIFRLVAETDKRHRETPMIPRRVLP